MYIPAPCRIKERTSPKREVNRKEIRTVHDLLLSSLSARRFCTVYGDQAVCASGDFICDLVVAQTAHVLTDLFHQISFLDETVQARVRDTTDLTLIVASIGAHVALH